MPVKRPSLQAALLCSLLATQRGGAEALEEYDFKAALLYNFALLTEWPQPPSDVFRLCVYGHNPFGNALAQLEKKKVKGVPLRIEYPRSTGQAHACQLLYVYTQETGAHELVVSLRNAPVLTVADHPNVLARDIMVNLNMQNNQVVFDINHALAEQSHLYLSSRLLRLARSVQ